MPHRCRVCSQPSEGSDICEKCTKQAIEDMTSSKRTCERCGEYTTVNQSSELCRRCLTKCALCHTRPIDSHANGYGLLICKHCDFHYPKVQCLACQAWTRFSSGLCTICVVKIPPEIRAQAEEETKCYGVCRSTLNGIEVACTCRYRNNILASYIQNTEGPEEP